MIDAKSSAQSLVDIATQQNPSGTNTMPTWRAKLLMAVIAIELLADILAELRIANKRRKAGES